MLTSYSFGKSQTADIPKDYHVEQINQDNRLLLLSRGEEALQARLDLLAKATKSIEVEYYIYSTDRSAKLLTLELIKAARRGVKVRMLIDGFLSGSGINRFYAHELQKKGIEFRYYNAVPAYRLSTIHFRNHRKLIVVDDQNAIIGGRNISNEYFNHAEDLNFDDRDVLVSGPIARDMRKSFDLFWASELSSKPIIPQLPKMRLSESDQEFIKRVSLYQKRSEAARQFTEEEESDRKFRLEILKYARSQGHGKSSYLCPQTTFVSDAPGASFGDRIKMGYMDNFRFVRKALFDRLQAADKRVIISSPYFIANTKYRKILDDLLNRDVDLLIYSNSLASTDGIMMSAALYWYSKDWVKKGLKLFLHDGGKTEPEGVIGGTNPKIWATHAKTHIYESTSGTEVMIGTSNFDNRSDFYNTELAIFCKGNDEFINEVRADVMFRLGSGLSVDENYRATNRQGRRVDVTGATVEKIFAMRLLSIPARLIDFLL